MAASPALVRMSVEEYLTTDFQPDADFVDGVIVERNWGEWDHAQLQAALLRVIEDHESDWEVRVVPEVRVQVGPASYRVPDICVTMPASALSRSCAGFRYYASRWFRPGID